MRTNDGAVSTITSKHQITVPRAVRDALGLRVGDELEWKQTKDGIVVKRRIDRKRAARWVGHLKDPELVGRDPVDIIREMRDE